MMEEGVPFGSHEYNIFFVLLLFARATDFLSTWIATPNLVLEANPIARKLRWKWGIVVNFFLCVGFAFWPLTAVIISTTSVLVAARNFQSAWLMRSMGEERYRDWHVERIQETRITLYLFCLAGNTMLTAGVGAAVVYFSDLAVVPAAIEMGIINYADAVTFFTLLGIWRMRRSALREASMTDLRASNASQVPANNGRLIVVGVQEEAEVQAK